MRPGEDAAALAGEAMDGEATFFFPAFDGAFVPAEECRDFLPGVDAAIFSGTGRCAGHHKGLNLSRMVPGELGRGGNSIATLRKSPEAEFG